jgi:hypothetical protein
MSVTVLQWRSRRDMSALTRLVSAPGHASLVVAYPDKSGRTRGVTETITWFPSGQTGGSSGGSSGGSLGTKGKWVPQNIFDEMSHMNRGGRQGLPTLQEWMDDNGHHGWVQLYQSTVTDPKSNFAFNTLLNTQISPPDRSVTIISRSDPDEYTGLYDSAMVTWWHDFAAKQNEYHTLTRSCAGVVGMALVAGGASEWVGTPSGFWTPESVYEWGVAIQKKVKDASDKIKQARTRLKQEADKVNAPGDVWTAKQWYDASEEKVSFLSRRYGELKTIDERLKFYEELKAKKDVTDEFRRQAEVEVLTQVLTTLNDIIVQRSGTKRMDAFAKLAAQCLNRTKAIKEEEEEERLHQQQLAVEAQQLKDKHNAPINERLHQISMEQFRIMQRMMNPKTMQKAAQEQKKEISEILKGIQEQRQALEEEQKLLKKQLMH